MEEKNRFSEEESPRDSQTRSPQEIRREARRKVIKTGLMSVPFIMTVHSRPLFAQTNGTVGALGYGGYGENTLGDEVLPQVDRLPENPYDQRFDYTGQDDFNFMRSRNPRAQFEEQDR